MLLKSVRPVELKVAREVGLYYWGVIHQTKYILYWIVSRAIEVGCNTPNRVLRAPP